MIIISIPGHLVHSFPFPRVCCIPSLPGQIIRRGDNSRSPPLLGAGSDSTNTWDISCYLVLQILGWEFFITLKKVSYFQGCIIQWKLNVVIFYWRQQLENVIKIFIATCIKYDFAVSGSKTEYDTTYKLPYY